MPNKTKLFRKTLVKLLQMPFFMAAIIFIPAWTIDYWQGWVFLVVSFLCTFAITLHLAIYDPALLARRMNAGPKAEKDKKQKVIMTVAFISMFFYVIFPAIDYRFGWSTVPAAFVFFGNALVVLGFGWCFWYLKKILILHRLLLLRRGRQ